MTTPIFIHIHPDDNVVVAIRDAEPGDRASVGGGEVIALEPIPKGHKMAVRKIASGENIIRYGFAIGHATEDVALGGWIHSHNMVTNLSDVIEYVYEPRPASSGSNGRSKPTFMGYRRKDGRVGTRNEIWIINTVGCVNMAAQRIASTCNERFRNEIDGVFAFAHPFGCSQLGDDLEQTRRVLAGLVRHPNAGGVLVLGLGCENNQMDALLAEAGEVDRSRIRNFNSQEVLDEVEAGMDAVEELVQIMREDRRTECPISDLVLGVKCGGSDSFSGISANPLVGRVTDRLTADGGTVIQTEVPEMFGAEQILMNRAADQRVFERIVAMINDFKRYYLDHDQPIYENPSPGNKEGGLTTLEEKSLGATQKGGSATVTQVLRYGERVGRGGLALLQAPGNDGVSVTAEVVSGATLVLFTTGRGTPLGFPVPTLKISSNTAIAEKKPHWIDFNSGALLDGTATMEELEQDLYRLIAEVASGEKKARNEENNYREIAIWKDGVTL